MQSKLRCFLDYNGVFLCCLFCALRPQAKLSDPEQKVPCSVIKWQSGQWFDVLGRRDATRSLSAGVSGGSSRRTSGWIQLTVRCSQLRHHYKVTDHKRGLSKRLRAGDPWRTSSGLFLHLFRGDHYPRYRDLLAFFIFLNAVSKSGFSFISFAQITVGRLQRAGWSCSFTERPWRCKLLNSPLSDVQYNT